MLYITDRNSCFKSEVKETTLILPHTDVTRSDKVSAAHKGTDSCVESRCATHACYRSLRNDANRQIRARLEVLFNGWP